MKPPKPANLHNPQAALGDYLDQMLHRATAPAEAGDALDLNPEDLIRPGLTASPPDEAIPVAAEPVSAEPAANKPIAFVPVAAEPLPSTCTANSSDLEFPLQCLMFRVGGHLLSVPLIQLSGVVNWSESISKLPQSPSWMLGLLPYREQKLRVVDCHRLLDIDAAGEGPADHLLVLGDSDWAITCDHLEQVVSLQRDEIKWPAGANPLILGTIRKSLSTLLNPAGICAALEQRING